MAFSSGSTLQQTDEAAVAPGSSGGGGGGGVSTSAIDGLETTLIGIPPPEVTLIRHLVTSSISIGSVIMDAKVAPSGSLGIVVERIDSSSRSVLGSTSVTLPGGQNRVQESLSISLSSSDILEVSVDPKTGQYSDDAETLTVKLGVS
jgi:hypothetical protein